MKNLTNSMLSLVGALLLLLYTSINSQIKTLQSDVLLLRAEVSKSIETSNKMLLDYFGAFHTKKKSMAFNFGKYQGYNFSLSNLRQPNRNVLNTCQGRKALVYPLHVFKTGVP